MNITSAGNIDDWWNIMISDPVLHHNEIVVL